MAQAICGITDDEERSAMFWRVYHNRKWTPQAGDYFTSIGVEGLICRVVAVTSKYVIMRRICQYQGEYFVYHKDKFFNEPRFLHIPWHSFKKHKRTFTVR